MVILMVAGMATRTVDTVTLTAAMAILTIMDTPTVTLMIMVILTDTLMAIHLASIR